MQKRSTFEVHLKKHIPDDKNLCKICNRTFENPFRLREHISVIHEKRRDFACELCTKKFGRKVGLKKHLETHSKSGKDIVKIEKKKKEKLASKTPVENALESAMEGVFLVENNVDKNELLDKSSRFIEYIKEEELVIKKEMESDDEPLQHLLPICKLEVGSSIKDESQSHRSNQSSYIDDEFRDECSDDEIDENSEVEPSINLTQSADLNDEQAIPKEYFCELCPKKYTAAATLRKHHLTFHEKRKDFHCKLCNISFAWKKTLKHHLEQHTQYIEEQDQQDEDNLDDQDSLKFQCDKCDKSYTAAGTLRKHQQTIHEKRKDFACNICNASFAWKNSLKYHQNQHLKKKIFCEICNRSCDNEAELQSHRLTAHEFEIKKKLPCDQCEQKFTNRTNLKRHILSMHEKKVSYTCHLCQEGFLTPYHMGKHMKRVHDDGLKLTRKCGACQLEFQIAKEFYEHILSHEGAHICKTCGCYFDDSITLGEHQKIHRKVDDKYKKIICDICGLRFTIKGHLKVCFKINVKVFYKTRINYMFRSICCSTLI